MPEPDVELDISDLYIEMANNKTFPAVCMLNDVLLPAMENQLK